jgi:hypothetical protein
MPSIRDEKKNGAAANCRLIYNMWRSMWAMFCIQRVFCDSPFFIISPEAF